MKQHVRVFGILIILLLLISGCGSALPASGGTGEDPTSLKVQRVNDVVPGIEYPAFAPQTISDQKTVQDLFQAAQNLPHLTFTSGTVMCPINGSLEYEIDFSQQQTILQKVVLHPGGCAYIFLVNPNQPDKKDGRVFDDAFFQLLAKDLNTTKAALLPQPLRMCNPHSPCPSPSAVP